MLRLSVSNQNISLLIPGLCPVSTVLYPAVFLMFFYIIKPSIFYFNVFCVMSSRVPAELWKSSYLMCLDGTSVCTVRLFYFCVCVMRKGSEESFLQNA